MNTDKLAVFFYQHFDPSFSRSWDDLPDHVREHWLQVARELAPELHQLMKEVDQ